MSWECAHAEAFNLSTLRGRVRQISEFEARLVYKESPRMTKGTQRNLVFRGKDIRSMRVEVVR